MRVRTVATKLATALAIVSLSACASVTGPGQSQSPTESVAPVYETAPLTGIQYEQGTVTSLAGPSVAAKIDNSEAARPQQGLHLADIVFDEMVEGGLTRLVAVWHSQMPAEFGPVRSIRPMDPDIISPFGGIICYSGGQKKFVDMIRATNVFNASETSEQTKGTFFRSKDRFAPHNVIVRGQKLQSQHTDIAPPSAQFAFATDLATASAATSGEDLDSAIVQISAAAIPSWTFDLTKKSWMRSYGSVAHSDVSGVQLSAVNVVIMQVKIDRTYGYVPKTVMVDTGKVWVLTGGKVLTGKWSKASQTSPIKLTDASGAEIKLAPGNTWVELLPDSGKLTLNKPKTK